MLQVFADQGDGDSKSVTIVGDRVTILPSGSDEKWKVEATVERGEGCACLVDFDGAYPRVRQPGYWVCARPTG